MATDQMAANASMPSKLAAFFKPKSRRVREYTDAEEVANAFTHGVGIVLSVVAICLLVRKAWIVGGAFPMFSAVAFGASLIFQYLMSTLYHATRNEGAKHVFKVLDHCGIYALIAGSYTPYCLLCIDPTVGQPFAIAVWCVALVGIAMETFWVFRPRWISAAVYLAMGWCVVALLPALHGSLASAGFWLLVVAGISYTIGAVFYVLKKIPFMHSVFHCFVLVGSVLQFLSVYIYVL